MRCGTPIELGDAVADAEPHLVLALAPSGTNDGYISTDSIPVR